MKPAGFADRVGVRLEQHLEMACLLRDIVKDAVRDDVGMRAVTIDRDLVVRANNLLQKIGETL